MKYARPTYEHSVNGNTTRRINKRIPINVNNIHRISLEVSQHPLRDDRDVPMFGLHLFQLRYQLTNPHSTPPLLSSLISRHVLGANVRCKVCAPHSQQPGLKVPIVFGSFFHLADHIRGTSPTEEVKVLVRTRI